MKTGLYSPPKGLKLDPKKGFVISEMDQMEEKSLKIKLSQLNKNLDIQTPLLKNNIFLKKKEVLINAKK